MAENVPKATFVAKCRYATLCRDARTSKNDDVLTVAKNRGRVSFVHGKLDSHSELACSLSVDYYTNTGALTSSHTGYGVYMPSCAVSTKFVCHADGFARGIRLPEMPPNVRNCQAGRGGLTPILGSDVQRASSRV